VPVCPTSGVLNLSQKLILKITTHLQHLTPELILKSKQYNLMKIFTALFLTLLFASYGYTQSVFSKKYSPQQLKQDLDFLKQQLFNAHADPFTELSKTQYENLFDSIGSKITDSADITTFYKLIKPVFANLSDEHSAISIDTTQLNNTYKNGTVFLPFTLVKQGNGFLIDHIFQPIQV
jgi:hypothetical protein